MPALAAAQRGSATLRSLTTTLTNLTLRAPTTQQPSTATKPIRLFSTTNPQLTKTIALHRIPSDAVPAYPYGPRLLYKQSNSGLHGTLRPQTGNNVSSKHGVRTPRSWRPNIHRKRLWSPSLGAWVRTRLSLRVLRTIRKEGSIDAYVLGTKASRVRELGPGGWKLRWLIMQTSSVRAQFDAQRAALGVDKTLVGSAEDGVDPALVVDKDELVHIMVDSATPGGLGAKSREYIEKRAMQLGAARVAKELVDEEFGLGEEADVPESMIAQDADEFEPVVTEREIEEVKKP